MILSLVSAINDNLNKKDLVGIDSKVFHFENNAIHGLLFYNTNLMLHHHSMEPELNRSKLHTGGSKADFGNDEIHSLINMTMIE